MWRSYIAIGDSATEGVGDDVGGLVCRSWTDLVADTLASVGGGLHYRNLGKKGATAPVVLSEQVPLLRDAGPDLVSVTVGANDARRPDWTAAEFSADYEAILSAIDNGRVTILTLAYPDIADSLRRAGHEIRQSWRPYFERVHAVNDVIRRVGERHGAYLVDLEALEAAKDLRYISADFTHPNALGYLYTAKEALKLLGERCGLPGLADALSEEPASPSKSH